MVYANLNASALNNSLSYVFVYANQVTNGMWSILTVFGFFFLVLISSMVTQLKVSGGIRPETSFLASSFVTLIFALIIAQTVGLSMAWAVITFLAMTIIGLVWVMLPD